MGRTLVPPVKLFFQNLPPQPRNGTHMGNHRLTPLANAFKDDITERMERTKLKDGFKNCTSIKLFLTVYTPIEIFVTLDGNVSKTSIDFDAHKLLIDQIAKYFGFNDGLIVEFEFDKRPIEGSWCFEVTIMDWSNEVCLHPQQESTVIGIASSRGYHILD